MNEAQATPVRFRVRGMDVPEFIVLRQDAEHLKGFDIKLDAAYAVQDVVRIIQPRYKITLSQTDSPFLMATVVMAFEIEPESWSRLFNPETRELVIPQSLASHMGVLVVGAIRGILFERLRLSAYANLVLPTIDISALTNEHRMVLAPTPHA